MNLILMGVAGCGKTTVGLALAKALGRRYIEGDAFHSDANRKKMSAGQALNDEDRWPWLDTLAAQLNDAEGQAVLSCSALKRRYRERLQRSTLPLRIVWLNGERELIATRLGARQGHYMPASLLASQFDALEPPTAVENVIVIDIDQSTEMIVEAIISNLRLGA